MNGVLVKSEVNKANRTFAVILGSRDGAIIRSVMMRQSVEGPNDQARAAWSTATIVTQDVIDGVEGTNLFSTRLENKIAYQRPVDKANATYSVKISSRNGAVISSAMVYQGVEESNV